MGHFLRNLGLSAFGAMAMLAAAPAQASIEFITPSGYSPTERFGGIDVQSLGLNFGGTAGRFVLTARDTVTLAQSTFNSFCIDVATSLFSYTPYSDVSASTVFSNATHRAQLAALLAFGNPLIDHAATPDEASDIAASIALAVWEIVYDGDNMAGYDVTSGNFSVFGDFSPLAEQANHYLGNVTDGTWTADGNRLHALISDTGLSQNQIYVGGIPEPATWAMMILGFGVIGSALRRRRQVASAATA